MDQQTQKNGPRRTIIDFPSNPGGIAASPVPDLISFLESDDGDECSYEIVSVKQVGTYAVVIASLRVESGFRDGIGICHMDDDRAIEIAERRALTDAASKFATGPFVKSGREGGSRRFSGKVRRPEAASIGDMISYSQLSEARKLASELELSADDESERRFGCRLSELSRFAADTLIESLSSYAPRHMQIKQAG